MFMRVAKPQKKAIAFLPSTFDYRGVGGYDGHLHEYVVGGYWHEGTLAKPVASFGAVELSLHDMHLPMPPADLDYETALQLATRNSDVIYPDPTSMLIWGAYKLGHTRPWQSRMVFGEDPELDSFGKGMVRRVDCDEAELQAMLADRYYQPAGTDAWYLYKGSRP